MSLKKRLIQAGSGLALAGLFTVANTNSVDAAEWQPTTVSEIKAEIDAQASDQDGVTEYTFNWGDTLWGISEATGISIDKLAQVNDIENSSMITVGNSIYLSNDNSVVSVEDENHNVKSYDVSEEEVKETETPEKVKEKEAQKPSAKEQAEADRQAAAEQEAAEQAEADRQAAAEQEAAEQAEADRQAAAEQEAAEQAEADRQAAAEQEAAEQAEADRQAAAEQAAAEQAAAEQEAAEQAEADRQAAAQEDNDQEATPSSSQVSGSEAEAKEWIAQRESGGDYNAVNPTGKYIGRYQLTNSYLGGDHSPANQERVANNYVNERYGSWTEAKAFWQANGWY